MKNLIISVIVILQLAFTGCRKNVSWDVYAVKYLDYSIGRADNVAIGGNPDDSVRNCFMVWLLKGSNGKTILVDAGYIDTATVPNKKYVRPDIVLQRINVYPSDISDIILTHPHWDHIGGISLFPKAKVWMQKADFEYYVSRKWQSDGFERGFTTANIKDILKVQDEGRLNLVEGDSIELFPGIQAFTGSRHSFNNQYLLVNANKGKNKVLLASDASWFYYNLDKLLSVPLVIDPDAYIKTLKRMKSQVSDHDFIIPGHDELVFEKFPKAAEWIVKIEK
jgi:glyoxylase-like metal-dependent hydrolase (beta-lactamase superfamily II)